MTDRFDEGQRTRRQVLGDAYVDRALGAAAPLEAPLQRLITEAAWGHVWSSDALSRRERSMITLALLAGLGNLEEFELHLRATVRTGATPEDVAQVIQHVAIYAGVPRANSAMKLARRVLAEIAAEGGTT
jgi:4-carboxymuconolactone decarboxylase